MKGIRKRAQLSVFPHVWREGYEGGEPNPHDEKMDPDEAFQKRHPHDELFALYDVPELEGSLRLKQDSVEPLRERGMTPQMKWLAADIDAEEDPREYSEELQDAGVYQTPKGWRAVWELDPPRDIEEGQSELESLYDRLSEEGVSVDPSTKDWTRLHRLPRTNRGFPEENQYFEPDVVDFSNMGTR